MKTKLIQANSPENFDKECAKAVEEGFMFVGQVVITGLGNKQFMYTQQWAKGVEEINEESNEQSAE